MTTNQGTIIIYSLASLGILAIVGYNFWGWFGGSAKWKSEHPNKIAGAESGTGSIRYVNQPSQIINLHTPIVNCMETRVINGITYTLVGVWSDMNNNYYATFAAQGKHEQYIKISKSEAINLIKKCEQKGGWGVMPKNGDACITADKKQGTILNGVCYDSGGVNPTNTDVRYK